MAPLPNNWLLLCFIVHIISIIDFVRTSPPATTQSLPTTTSIAAPLATTASIATTPPTATTPSLETTGALPLTSLEEREVTRNNLIGQIPQWKRTWHVSFEFKLLDVSPHWTNIIRFSTGSRNLGYGMRIPMVIIRQNTTVMSVCTGIDDSNNWCTWSTLELNLWYSLEISQFQEELKYYFAVRLNHTEVRRVENTKPQIYRDVNVFASDALHQPARAMIRKLQYYNLPQDEFTLISGTLIDTIPTWSPTWYVTFQIKPMGIHNTWSNILRFTAGIGNRDSIGDRAPGLWFTRGMPKLHVGTALGNKVNHVFTSENIFPLHSWTEVEVVQKVIESKTMLVVRINGTVVHQVENTIPRTFFNVRVFASDEFYDPAIARVRQIEYGNLPDDYCHLPNAPIGAVGLGAKCIMVMDLVKLKYNGEGIAYCAEKYGGEMITLNSLEEFNQLTDYLQPGVFLAAASDREEEGVLKWQDNHVGTPLEIVGENTLDKNCIRIVNNLPEKWLEWYKCTENKYQLVCQWRHGLSECTKDHGFQYKNKCFREFSQDVLKRSDADEMCHSWGATLIMPDSSKEVQFISDFLRYRRTWMGATDSESEGLLKWDDGTTSATKLTFLTERNIANSRLKILGAFGRNFPSETNNGKVYLGGIVDERFDPEEIITFENKQDRTAPNQWLGFQDRIFANEYLKIEFWIKFVSIMPLKSNGFGIKVYGVIFNGWLDGCVVDEWCQVSLEIQNRNSGDGDHVLQIFDTISHKQIVRIAKFGITIGKGEFKDGDFRSQLELVNQAEDKDCTRFKPIADFSRMYRWRECEINQNDPGFAALCQKIIGEIVSEWGEWSPCSRECKRGTQTRTRICYDKTLFDEDENSCGGELLTDEQECSTRENCQGSGYYLAEVQQTCDEFCASKELSCSSEIETGDSINAFVDVLLSYTIDPTRSGWQKTYSPGCLVGNVCVEFEQVPNEVICDQRPEEDNFRRFCHCVNKTDVGFGPWSPWSECSVTCNGTRNRQRTCFDYCDGQVEEIENCGAQYCPIHGGLSEWSQWSSCDASCGGGTTTRTRLCDAPAPQYNGNDCIGNLVDSNDCGVGNCPVDATWTEWSVWSSCDKPCNTGYYVRRRTCNPANYGGNPDCPGPNEDKQPCNVDVCREKILTCNLRFEYEFVKEMLDPESIAYKKFKLTLEAEMRGVYAEGGGAMKDQLINIQIHSLQPGSVIANFTVVYASMDQDQTLFFQDNVEMFGAFGKLEILPSSNNTFEIGPDLLTEPPSNVTAFSPSLEILSISWNALNQSNVDNYIIFYREKLLSNQPYSTYATENTTAHLTWLKPGTEYVYRVLAFSNGEGNGIASLLSSVWTMEKLPLVSPSDIKALSSGPFSIYVSWNGVPQEQMNGIPLGYHIYAYSQNSLVSTQNVSFDLSGVSYTEGLESSTSYIFEVCAFNSAGDGPCDKASARTLNSAPSAPPANIHISSIKTHTQLTIHWSPPPADQIHGDLLSYKIKVFLIKSGADVYINPKIDIYDLHPSLNSLTLKFLDANTFYDFELMAVNQFGEGVSENIVGRTCLCPPVVSTNYYLLAPYLTEDADNQLSGVFGEILQNAIQATCGVCNSPNGLLHSKLDTLRNGRESLAKKTSEFKILKEVDEFTDLSFPIIGNTHSDEMVGYPFVPLIGHPGVVAIVRDKNINEIVIEMIMMILGIYPLIGLNFLMMVVAGYIVWLLEACNNPDEDIDFSKTWIRGIYEGWYWAFITQGTHGFGDFTVTRFYSRCFAVVWSLFGVVMTSLVIGALVTALTTVNGAAEFKVYGSEVGALNGSFEEKLGLLRNGKVNEKRAYKTITELRDDLLANEIKGVLLDAYTAGANAHLFADERLRVATKLEYPRSYGFVLSGDLKSMAAEFRSYIKSDEERILKALSNSTVPMGVSPPAELKSPFDPESSILSTALVSMTIMFVVFSIFGLLWSHYLKKLNQKNAQKLDKKDIFNQCNDMVANFKSSIDGKITELEEKHSLQRKLLFKDYYGYSAIDHHARHGINY